MRPFGANLSGDAVDDRDDLPAAPGSPRVAVFFQNDSRLDRGITGSQVELQVGGEPSATPRAETGAIGIGKGVAGNPVLPESGVSRERQEETVWLQLGGDALQTVDLGLEIAIVRRTDAE